MDRKYKPIRPAVISPAPRAEGFDFTDRTETTAKRKRVHVKVACDACRSKKTACDGHRPVCGPCVKRKSPCTFRNQAQQPQGSTSSSSTVTGASSPDRDRYSKASRVLNALVSAPDDERALELLAQLRKGEDLSNILDASQGAFSFIDAPDQSSDEFELMIRHPIPFPTYMSLDSSLYATSRPRGTKETSEFNFAEVEVMEATAEQPRSQTNSTLVSPVGTHARPAEPLCDSRLGRTRFKDWTDVPIENATAAHILSRFLQVDHPILGLFDADLFLHDLANSRTRYCSRFLVNALLSWACLGYMPPDVTDQAGTNIAAEFFDSSIKIWNDEKGDTVTTVAALQFLSLAATYSGQGDIGKQLLREGIMMGKRLGLLRDGAGLKDESAPQGDDLTATAQTAWGLFSHATMHSMFCQQSELEGFRVPDLSIPGDGLSTEKAKEAMRPPPIHIGQSFPQTCQMWTIIHDMVSLYYSKESAPRQKRYDPGFAQFILHRLLQWADALPTNLARGNQNTHDVIIMHIHFHIGLMTLLRPLKLLQTSTVPLAFGTITDGTIKGVYSASTNQLKRLVTIYQAHFNPDAPTVLWHAGCLNLANETIGGPDTDPQRRYYFDGAIESYAGMYPRFSVTIAIVKGLMAMAINSGLISSEEAYETVRKLREGGKHHVLLAEPTDAAFVVDLNLAAEDREGGHIDSLASEFDEMQMFDEFTFSKAEEPNVDVKLPWGREETMDQEPGANAEQT